MPLCGMQYRHYKHPSHTHPYIRWPSWARRRCLKMQTDLSGTSVIFVKVTPGHVERTLTTLRGKPNVASAEGVLGRHDIVVAGNFRDSDTLRGFQSEVQQLDYVRGDRRARSQRVRAHPDVEPEAGDQRLGEVAHGPDDHRYDRGLGHRRPHRRGHERGPPPDRREPGPEHAGRPLHGDIPGVPEALKLA